MNSHDLNGFSSIRKYARGWGGLPYMGYVFVFLFSYYTGPVFVSLLQGRFSVFCFNFDEETKQLFVGNYRLISLVLRDVWYVTLASRIKVCKIFFGVDLSEKIFLANECLFIYGTHTCIWFSSLHDQMTLAGFLFQQLPGKKRRALSLCLLYFARGIFFSAVPQLTQRRESCSFYLDIWRDFKNVMQTHLLPPWNS